MTERRLMAANRQMECLREARRRLAAEVEQLMRHSDDEQLRWNGSVADLMEALYYAYEEQTITDGYGLPLAFSHIVERCCSVLHVRMPRNPYQMAARGRQRKGLKSMSYMKRYLLMAEQAGDENALLKGVSATLYT